MTIATMVILVLSILDLLAFIVIAVVGFVHGVNYPFPAWFSNESDACFYLGLALALLSLPFLASTQQRHRAALSLGISLGTVMIIAFLTSQG